MADTGNLYKYIFKKNIEWMYWHLRGTTRQTRRRIHSAVNTCWHLCPQWLTWLAVAGSHINNCWQSLTINREIQIAFTRRSKHTLGGCSDPATYPHIFGSFFGSDLMTLNVTSGTMVRRPGLRMVDEAWMKKLAKSWDVILPDGRSVWWLVC